MTAFKQLPSAIYAGGLEIPINTDFRASMAFESLLQTPLDGPKEQTARILQIYFSDESLPLIGELVARESADTFLEAVLHFYRCGKEERGTASERSHRPIYSFIHDEDMIFAAFLQQYGIDLYNASMHWWKFRSMFSNLPDSCEIIKAMQIRGREMEPGMSGRERRALRKAKAAYTLPDLRTPEQIEADFADGFTSMF